MSNQPSPCNECWSEASIIEGHEDCECGYDDEYIGCSNDECKNYVFGENKIEAEIHYHDDYESERFSLIARWNAANPISHAAKMLLEKSSTRDCNCFDAKPVVMEEHVETYTCLYCAGKVKVSALTDNEAIDSLLKIKHLPSCTLITEAKLSLETKEKS